MSGKNALPASGDSGNPPQQDREQPQFPPIPGLDVATAIDRLAGNRRLYAKTLCMLLDLAPQHEAEMDAALASRNWRELHRAVHTMKGLAGTVGALELHAQTLELENTLKQPEEQWDAIGPGLNRFKNTLSSLLSTIAAAGVCDLVVKPGQEHTAPASALLQEEEQRRQLLASLAVLLEESDSTAPQFFQENLQQFRTLLPMGVVMALDTSLNSFNYDAALAVLRRVRDSHA